MTAYPFARKAAERVHPHFEKHFRAPRDGTPPDPALLPDIETLTAILDAAFWASLRREEGYSPLISLAFVAPSQVDRPMTLERPVALSPEPLTHLGPAVERPGIHLGVWRKDGELNVWGATRDVPPACFVLEVIAPGLLVIKHSRGGESGKFVNVAVIEGEQIKIVDQRAAIVPDCPALLISLLGLESAFSASGAANVLIQLAVSMRAHGRGGLLLVVPSATDAWRESILHPITYSVSPPFTALAHLMQADARDRKQRRWQDALRQAVEGLAGLTAVDGATILTDRHELLAFGAKIVRRRGREQVAQVVGTEPIEGAGALITEPALLGGTRHLAAAQFAHDQREAIAMVASQDGRFTVFGWSPCEDMVHAHRIESLLL
jgi:hypothetical protein